MEDAFLLSQLESRSDKRATLVTRLVSPRRFRHGRQLSRFTTLIRLTHSPSTWTPSSSPRVGSPRLIAATRFRSARKIDTAALSAYGMTEIARVPFPINRLSIGWIFAAGVRLGPLQLHLRDVRNGRESVCSRPSLVSRANVGNTV